MHDHVYRMGIAWQNTAYNQPPHLGYYLPDRFEKTAGMSAVETATNGPSMIFNLNGVRQQGSLDTLPRGIYIVKQDDKVRKVIIATHQM